MFSNLEWGERRLHIDGVRFDLEQKNDFGDIRTFETDRDARRAWEHGPGVDPLAGDFSLESVTWTRPETPLRVRGLRRLRRIGGRGKRALGRIRS